LIEGFPGMGLAGTIAAKYLVERLKFQQLGYIDANIFVPIIRIHEGLPIFPSRIYVNEEKKLVVIISEQIIPRFYTEQIAKAVVGWIKTKKISRVISLAGINTGQVNQRNVVYGIASTKDDISFLKKHKIEVIQDGITTGITALILLELSKSKIEAVSILGNVKIQADYKAASSLIEKLNSMLSLNINIEPLLKEARQTEEALLKHMQELKKTHSDIQKIEDRTPMTT
jgi:uncharacterized protein